MPETSKGAEYSKQKERRGYSSVLAIDPHDGKEWDVLISGKFLENCRKEGMGRCRELAEIVLWALRHPVVLYRGLRDDERELDEDDWLCYVASPANAYDYKTGKKVPAWDGEVLLVCVNEDRVLYNWWWVKCEPGGTKLPVDHEDRFRDKVF